MVNGLTRRTATKITQSALLFTFSPELRATRMNVNNRADWVIFVAVLRISPLTLFYPSKLCSKRSAKLWRKTSIICFIQRLLLTTATVCEMQNASLGIAIGGTRHVQLYHTNTHLLPIVEEKL